MSSFIYHSQKEFDEACLANVARMIADKASKIHFDGNIADIAEESLDYLGEVAEDNHYSVAVIYNYLDIVRSANNDFLDFDEEGELSPLGFQQGTSLSANGEMFLVPRCVTRG